MKKTDLIIIGAGPGGYDAAVKAAKAGLKVTIIEKEHCGGTCLNTGCIPTKTFCKHAELLEELKAAEDFGINLQLLSFDMAKVVDRKNTIVKKLEAAIQELLKTPGITFIRGEAQFVTPHTISVEKEIYSAPNIIIATGSSPKFLPIEGAQYKGVVTSTEMLNLEKIPNRLCIIGGGVIGLEFASIFNSFGSRVTVVEFCKEILPTFDHDISKRLRTILKKKGIEFKLNSTVIGIKEKTEATLEVKYEEKGTSNTIEADLVLMAVGRSANLSSLNFEEVGIKCNKHGVEVNEHMQTSIPGVYAVGDINGTLQLAHAATFQSYIALNHILGQSSSLNLKVCPAAVFTIPELAMVGHTEDTLKKCNMNYITHKNFYRSNGKALAMGCEDGVVKVLTDERGTILGAHILGAHASDLIHEYALAMTKSVTIKDLHNTIHVHPSLSEIIMNT